MNLILWGEGSSAAIPFGTLVAILALWFCISVPLTFIGAYFGFKKNVSLLVLTYSNEFQLWELIYATLKDMCLTDTDLSCGIWILQKIDDFKV